MSQQIGKNQANFVQTPNGNRFAKGNKIGRMKKKGYTIQDLTNTALAYDKTHDVTILKHYIEELTKDNTLLKDFINKYVPTTNKNELSGPGGEPLRYIIEKSYPGGNEPNSEKKPSQD